MDSAHLSEQANRLLAELQRKHPLQRIVQLEWRSFRVTAGVAYYRRYVIGLSARLLTTEERLRETLLHEYAHLMAVDRYGLQAANHGLEWQAAMRELGLEPVRTHQYEVEPPRQRTETLVRCQRCGFEEVRRRRLMNGRKYIHMGCGGEVVTVARRVVRS